MKVLKNIRLKDITPMWFHRKTHGTYSKTSIKLLPFSMKRSNHSWKELKDSLAKGYDPEKYGYITVYKFFSRYITINGNHRISLLKKIYSEDYTIDVKGTSILKIMLSISFLIITVPLSFAFTIVNNLRKIVNNYIVQVFRIKKK